MKTNEAISLLQKQLLTNQYPYSYIGELLWYLSVDKENNDKLENWQESRLQYVLFLLKRDYPVEYIVQRALFCEKYFFVNKDVLIPRFDSEKLVHWVLDLPIYSNPTTIIDIGTGSGALVISVARELQRVSLTKHHFYATDISVPALAIAKNNAQSFDLSKTIQFTHTMLPQEHNRALVPNTTNVVIITNPPYISDMHYNNLPKSVLLYEPEIALKAQSTFIPALQDYINLLQQQEKSIHLAIEYNDRNGNMIQRFSSAKKVDLTTLLSL